MGFDLPVGPATRLGLGYAGTTIDSKSFGGAPTSTTTTNSYKATAYIAHEAAPWFVHLRRCKLVSQIAARHRAS